MKILLLCSPQPHTNSCDTDINNEQTIYLFNGVTRDKDTNSLISVPDIYSFNLNSSTWNAPTVKGIPPTRRREIKSVIDNTGKMYIFGGYASGSVGSPTRQYFNDMAIFNAVESSWSIYSNSPVITRSSYSATLLPNGMIAYIGGYDAAGKSIDISKIDLYDTNSLTWTSRVCILCCKIF